jgi:hypothetical protein
LLPQEILDASPRVLLDCPLEKSTRDRTGARDRPRRP